MEINANIQIDDSQLNEIVTLVQDSINITDDIETYLTDNVEDHVNSTIDNVLDDKIESYLYDNLDSAVERAVDNLDMSDRFDAESEARNLLNMYNPESPCSTGIAFRDAISATIAFLNVNDEVFKNAIIDVVKSSINDVVRQSIESMVQEELRKGVVSSLRSEIMRSLRTTFSNLEFI